MSEENVVSKAIENRPRLRTSLSQRVFWVVVLGTVLLGAVAQILGLVLYSQAAANRYITEAYTLCRGASSILERSTNTTELASLVMERYRAMTRGEKDQVVSPQYDAQFSDLADREDYRLIRSVLKDFLHAGDLYNLYLGMFEKEDQALVYIVDPLRTPSIPGRWKTFQRKIMDKFLNWSGEGELYHVERTKEGWFCTAGVPIQNESGAVTCFLIAEVPLGAVEKGAVGYLVQYTVLLFIVINLFGVLLERLLKKNLVDPVNRITDAAQAYAADKKAGAAASNHFDYLDIHTGDELENLGRVMADMERDLAEHEQSLTWAIAEQERISTELALAHRIQTSMLPTKFPAFPDRPEFDLYASMNPAKEVGGDFYDFFLIDEDHLGLAIADVSGKGVPAALFMMASKIFLRNCVRHGRGPAATLALMNRRVCESNPEEMFVTVWMGILELSTGKLTAANAGHEYPILKRPSRNSFELLQDSHGFVIGAMEDLTYKEYELKLEPGTTVLVYTDGVTEATNEEGKLFGTGRTLGVLNTCPGSTAQELIEAVLDGVITFMGNAPQFDDITMLCVRYLGPPKKEEEAHQPTEEMEST